LVSEVVKKQGYLKLTYTNRKGQERSRIIAPVAWEEHPFRVSAYSSGMEKSFRLAAMRDVESVSEADVPGDQRRPQDHQ